MIKEIEKLHRSMKELILDSGVSKEKYYRIIKGLDEKSHDELLELRSFLLEIHNGPYNTIRKFESQLPKHAWENYKILKFDIDDTPEMVYYREIKKELRKAYNNGAQKFKNRKKGSRKSEKDSESSTDRGMDS